MRNSNIPDDEPMGHPMPQVDQRAVKMKTPAQVAAEREKVDELALELHRQREERQAKADALAPLEKEAKERHEAAATAQEVLEQARRQVLQDAEDEAANRRANIAAWTRLNLLRRSEGQEPITYETYNQENGK